MQKYLFDTNIWISIWDITDPFHQEMYDFYQYYKVNDRKIVIPTMVYFEFQATKSAVYKRKSILQSPLRDWYVDDGDVIKFEISTEFTNKAKEQELFDKFHMLRGADLVVACVAKVEDAILVSNDKAFQALAGELEVYDSEFIKQLLIDEGIH